MEELCKGTFQVPGNNEGYCISLKGTELNTKSGILCQPEEPQISKDQMPKCLSLKLTIEHCFLLSNQLFCLMELTFACFLTGNYYILLYFNWYRAYLLVQKSIQIFQKIKKSFLSIKSI